MQLKAILLSAVVAMVLLSPAIEANSSGKHSSSGGCGCHSSGTSPTIGENFPSTYSAGQTYSIQVSVSGGVSGTKGGFNVEVSKGTLATGGSTSVKVSGTSITHTNNANRAWTFDWTAPSAGSGSVIVDIAGMTANGASGNNGDSWSTTSLTITETVVATNNPPTVTDVQISPVAATSSDDITLTYTFSDQDSGDTESGTTIQWSINGVHQAQFDGLMTISSDDITRGDDWQVSVTPSDGEDFGATVTSNIITVLNSLPSISSTTISPSNPTSDDDLTASFVGDEDNDGDVLTFEYRWYVGGVLQDGLNNLTTLPSIATRAGDSWEVEIRAFDGAGHSAWVRSNAISIEGQPNTVPTVDSITISPTNPTTSDSLIASSTSSDADMDSITDTEYRWWKNGVMTAISSSILESTTTTKGDVWVVEVRVNDGTDWSTWTLSSNIEIQNTAPQLESASISATEVTTDQDVTLSTIMSDVDGDTLTMNIVWDLNGTIQPEYNNQATLPSSATSKGNIWTAIVQADDGEATSPQSETLSVSILNSKPLLSIALDESVTSQDDLSIETTITDLDGDLTEISSITWFRNGFREGSLDGATTVPSSYLGPGQEWSVEVLVTDGEATGLSSSSITISNAPPTAIITVLTESAYAGERVQLTASASSDPDNRIVAYQWSWSSSSGGQSSTSGTDVSFLMPLSGSVSITLAVTDESGAIDESTTVVQALPALPCPSLTSTLDDGDVNLAWSWSSQESANFNVYRNGVLLGQTNKTSFADTPSILGLTTYKLTVTIGDRTLESDCQSPSTQITIDTQAADFDEGPSTTLGFGLGSLYMIIGILFLVAVILRRGD